MTLNLANIESGLTEWADEKEIRKVGSKSLFSN
jgi:PBP1b-binding outer membrane lipoprotein LpoB